MDFKHNFKKYGILSVRNPGMENSILFFFFFEGFPKADDVWNILVPCGLADVDVPLHSQHQGEVDAGVVKHLGCGLNKHLK